MTNDRIGVYICHCGGNISDIVDVYKVVEGVQNFPNVAVAKEFMFMCSDPGQKMIEDDIKDYELDGVVVASCSPHLHETTFRKAVARGGLNPFLFEHMNIREHSAWAHKHTPEEATEKATALVKSAIAKVSEARALERIRVDMPPKILILGAGISGIRSALDLAKMGIEVHLVEKLPFVGGRVAQGSDAYPTGRMGTEIIDELVEELKNEQSNIHLYTNSEVQSVDGFIGNFEVTIKQNPRYVVSKCDNFEEAIRRCPIEVPDEFNYGMINRKAIYYPYPSAYPELPAIDMEACDKCGECVDVCGKAIDLEQQPEEKNIKVSVITFATGFNPYEPKEGEFGYKQFNNVVTLPQFERLLALGNEKLHYGNKEIKDVLFVYCVGSRERDGDHPYCSRYCCTASINAALSATENYGIRTYHAYRDIRTYGKYENYYENVSKNGALFLKFSEDSPPQISQEGDKLNVKVKDELTYGEEIEVPVDMVVLSVGMEPRVTDVVSMLRVPYSADGFLQEVHPKLAPVETAIGGVLIAGACQGPKDTVEASASASATSAKSSAYLLKGYTEIDPFIIEIDHNKCIGSGECVEECPYGAIELKDVDGEKKAFVTEAICRGCGACAAVCPTEAINLRGYRYDQLKAQIEAMFKEAE
ncbi:MAG: CoB--CoM heterodisulfide reductase iron-sulfur subunit A family protein [Halobacteriota archaeon]